MKTAIIGLGLIGGSAALVLRDKGFSNETIGVDNNTEHALQAVELNIVNKVMPLEAAVKEADLIIIAVPVDRARTILPKVLDLLDSHQVVIDMGSTKGTIVHDVAGHPKRGRFVACHPMWGTEFSGPTAATVRAFTGKASIICNVAESDEDAGKLARKVLETLGMYVLYMDAEDHDVHTAYISHISHITSFALANTVLEKEKEEKAIFDLASAGFESTVRLAKSNATTWVPIFRQNKENLLDVLNEHLTQLRKFKSCLEKENWEYLKELIENANKIKKILH